MSEECPDCKKPSAPRRKLGDAWPEPLTRAEMWCIWMWFGIFGWGTIAAIIYFWSDIVAIFARIFS